MTANLASTASASSVELEPSDRVDRYLLGDSPAEVEHLIVQADVLAPEAEQLLDHVGLAPGASAIDIGCGAMGILHLLRARVGATGRVVGLDREPRLLAAAEQLARRRGLEIELVQADASSTALASGSFDFVHTRAVLVNVNNPDEIVAEMVRLARPGGVIAVQEPDTSCWVCDPPHGSWGPLREAVIDAYRGDGKDAELGRRAGRLLRAAGLDDVQVCATARVTQPGDYYQTFLLTMTALVRDQILDGRLLTADRLDAHTGALSDHLDAPGTLTCMPPFWHAWGVKP
jgi:SAM-dependent methyltransferase